VSDQRIRELMAYPCPGNIRELRNTAERHVLGIDIPLGAASADGGTSLSEAVEAFERSLIADALRRQSGNGLKTAKQLNIAKSTLFDKMRKYGLDGAV